MSWEKTHKPGGVGCKPWHLAAIFAQAGAVWKCDECGTRYEVTKTQQPSGEVTSGWRKL